MGATRSQFLDLVGNAVQALLDFEPRAGAVNVKLLVRDGEPYAAALGVDAREGD